MPTSAALSPTRCVPRAVALSLAAALATAGHPAAARAQEPPPRAPIAVADEPPELALPQSPVVDEARDLARAGRHAAAAVHLEAALAGTGDVRLLYHAGVARSLAGHHALAWRHFAQAVERGQGFGVAARQHLQARLAAAEALTLPVRLRVVRGPAGADVDPARLAGAQISVRAASGSPDSRVMFTLSGYRGEQLRLDPGPWIVQVQIRGYRPAELFRNALPGAADDTWQIAVVPEQVPVELRFSPPGALRGAHMRLTYLEERTRVVERDVSSSPLTMMLPSGRWQLDITARRRESHRELMVTPGMGPVPVELYRRQRRRSPKFERNDRLMVAVGVLLLTKLTVGAGLTLAGASLANRALNRNERLLMSALVDDATGDADGMPGLSQVEASYPTAGYHRDLARDMNLQTAGLVVTSSAIGMLIPALTVQSRMRRRAAYIEMGVGAAMLAGGAVWLADHLGRRDRALASGDPIDRLTGPDLRTLSGHNVGASALTGLGISLIVYPAIALLTDSVRKRRHGHTSLSPFMGPGQTGLALRGRF